MNELIINLIQSGDYNQRLFGEYLELKERYNKLGTMLSKYEAGVLEFELTCPISLLQRQRNFMWGYLKILKDRIDIEGIKGISTDALEVSK